MKNKFTWCGLIAIILLGTGICFVGCKDEVNAVVQYVGKVVYGGTTTPFAGLEVKVTNGDKIHCVTHTDKNGDFSLSVRVNEIDGSYYLLAGDSTCVPKKVKLGGYGQKKVDLGVIDVEGPTLPVVLTTPISNVSTGKAVSGGNVTSDGRSTVTTRGVCWSKSEEPTISDSHTTNGGGTGEFESQMTELEYNTVYYVRAYATNRLGTAYGNQIKFSTMSGKAEVKTDSVYAVTAVSAKCAGKVTDDGGFKVTARGVCWAKSPDPTTTDYIANEGSGKGTFVCALRNLDINAVYYVRAFATNETGTFYGEQVKIQTLDGMAVVELNSIKDITATSATVNAAVTYDCDIAVTERGVCWSTNQYPTIDGSHVVTGRGMGSYVSSITKLEYGTKYYVRAYATNSTGTAYSEQLMFTSSDGKAKVSTTKATNITATGATCGGNVTDDGTLTVTARGVCYATTQYPTIEGDHTTDGKGTGMFTSSLKNLNDKTTYYYRAYATTDAGTTYGEQNSFTTLDGSAKVTLGDVSDIKAASAVWTATVISDGGVKVTERGICYATNQYPTTESTHTIVGNGIGDFTSTLTNLTPNKLYYVRAYATNAVGTAYSEQQSFTTLNGLPIVTTAEISSIFATTARGGGEVTDDGGFPVTAYGLCWNTASNPTIDGSHSVIGKGKAAFTGEMTGLSANTLYYVRAYATNDIGTVYGNNVQFTTAKGIAGVKTYSITNITALTATGGGSVNDAGGATIKAVGICWATTQNPTITGSHTTDGNSLGNFTSNLTGLKPSTTYYVRAYCTTDVTTNYGEQVSFTTVSGLPVVTTSTATATSTTISTGGNITSDGGYTITARGVCWSTTNSSPDINDKTTNNGKGTGVYTSLIAELTPNTTYYVRAYATNQIGTAYGSAITIKTKDGKAGITTTNITNITALTATGGGKVTDAGGATIKAVGICWATTQNPTIAGSHTTDGNSLGSFTSNITGLKANTTYYVRAYCTTDVTTNYGDQVSFTTKNGAAAVTTEAVTNIKAFTATGGVTVTDAGGATLKSCGICWSSNPNPTIDNNKSVGGNQLNTTYSLNITDLTPDTKYYVRSYATTDITTAYGKELSFLTTKGTPEVTLAASTKVLTKSFVANANVTSDGGYSVTARGFCWSNTKGTPTISDSYVEAGTGIGAFAQTITNLEANTTYYIRAYATNSMGTVYSDVSTQRTGNGLQGVYFNSNPISNINAGSAVCKVSVDYKYSDVPIISEGVCWSSSSSTPTINDAKTNDGQATTTFSSKLTNLSPTTTYYVRAYITTSYGTSYSPTSVSFTTTNGLPKVTTNDITTANVTPSSFTCGGEITDEGDAPITARGICWNTTGSPTVSDSHSNNGTGKGSFTHTITGVSTHTQTYYVRAYATNKYGTSYGEVVIQNKNNPYKLPTFTLNNTTYMIYPTNLLGEMTWNKAYTTCENLNAYGFSDWRLPTKSEGMMFSNNKEAQRIYYTSDTYYWTSTQKTEWTGPYYYATTGNGIFTAMYYGDFHIFRPIRVMIQ